MKNDLASCLKVFINDNGKEALDNVVPTGRFIYSNVDSQYMDECEVLMVCLTLGYHHKLYESSQSERLSIKKEIAECLNVSEGLDLDLCSRTLDILETALVESETPLEEINEQSVSLEEKTYSEPEKEKQLIKELTLAIEERDEQNKNLVKEIKHLKGGKKYTKNTKNVPDEALRKAKKKYNTILFFFIISVITIFIVYSCMLNENSELLRQKESINTKYISLEENFANSKKIWTINVLDMKVGNSDQNNRWITRPDVQLNADAVRRLNPVFIYDSPTTCSMTFFIRIIDPQDEIMRDNRSPEGYTYSRSYQVRRGQSLEFDPDGWGNAQGGIYYPGIWKIELWSEGFCLYSGDVRLE